MAVNTRLSKKELFANVKKWISLIQDLFTAQDRPKWKASSATASIQPVLVDHHYILSTGNSQGMND